MFQYNLVSIKRKKMNANNIQSDSIHTKLFSTKKAH